MNFLKNFGTLALLLFLALSSVCLQFYGVAYFLVALSTAQLSLMLWKAHKEAEF